jgi:N-acetylmuramoyl-L-alanine amidase
MRRLGTLWVVVALLAVQEPDGRARQGQAQPQAQRFVDDCGLEPPGAPIVAPPRKAGGSIITPRLGPTGHQAVGALSGKTIYVSPGHGWYWTGGDWTTQRGNANGIVEDLVSAETIDQFLLQYLRLMGAHVVPLREADLNTNMVIVDDGELLFEGNPSIDPQSEDGFATPSLPMPSDAAPFEAGTAQRMAPAPGGTGLAVWPVAVPASGYYNVYVAYVQAPDRAPDARYLVRHAGGESEHFVDQRRHGSTWVLLGRYWFEEGAPIEKSSVALSNDASGSLSLDAVRAGGGEDLFDRGTGPAGRPMYEHCARYYTQWDGAPPSVYDYRDGDHDDDVVARSRFAAWDHEDGEDAVYIAWHTNAPNPGTGTSSYTYGPSPPPGPLSEFTGTPGSLELQAAVHGELIDDFRAVWDPAWPDRGMHTAYFGEVNPGHNDEMPAVLVEVAFHDTPIDAASLREPTFRRIATRAMAQGIARYFAERDGLTLVLPPEPPSAVRIENDGQGGLRVSWRPPLPDAAGGDAPDGYRVYTSRDGLAFDDGLDVAGEALALSNLGVGARRFVRVAARNAGGESLPSEVVGARVAPDGLARVLVVGGFDRIDSAQLPVEDLSTYALGLVDRMWLEQINDGSYASRHGLAILAASSSFDGASDEAVDAGDIDLASYAAVDWFLGEESSGNTPLTPEAQAALSGYLAGGGRLLITGSEAAWALDFLGTPDEQAFYRAAFHAAYADDDADTYDLLPVAGSGPYAGMEPFSFGDPAIYDPEWPDLLDPGAGGAAALDYSGGVPGHAAIAWSGGPDRGVVFGFPFESIEGEPARDEVMRRTLAFFEVEPEEFPPDGGVQSLDDTTGGCGCRIDGSGGDNSAALWAGVCLVLYGWLLRLRRRLR